MLDRALQGREPSREQGFLPSSGRQSGDLLQQLLESQRRTESYLQKIAEALSNSQHPATPQISYMDREAQQILGAEGQLSEIFRPQLVANVVAVGRVSGATGFSLRDDTKVFSEEIVGKTLVITSGPGVGERKSICGIGERPNILRFLRSFRSTPNASSTYAILDTSAYASMFESSRTWLGTTVEVVNNTNQNGAWPFFINPGAKGVIVHLNVANLGLGGSWSLRVEVRDFLNNAVELFRVQHWVNANGDYYYLLHPEATSPNYGTGLTEAAQGPLPIGGWQVRLVPAAAITADLYFDAQYI